MLTLAEQQRAFWSFATRAPTAAASSMSELFVRTDALDVSSRLEIYADMFIGRQVDSLREDFPKLTALLDDDFDILAEAYLREHPSRHHSLARLGEQLPRFLGTRGVERVDAGELAALEWARSEVFDEAEAESISSEGLRSLTPDRVLTFIPALRALHPAHEVARVWQCLEDGQSVPRPVRCPNTVIVWRKHYDVFHVRLNGDEAEAFARAAAGQPLASICEAFADQAEPAEAAFRAIGSWCAEGWLTQSSKSICVGCHVAGADEANAPAAGGRGQAYTSVESR